MWNQNYSTEIDTVERRKAFDQFVDSSARIFGMDLEAIGPKIDASWEHLKNYPADVWKQLERLAPIEWESWPRNFVFRIRQMVAEKHLESTSVAKYQYCEHCNGNGHFTGVVNNPNYYQGRDMKTRHTIMCRGCDNRLKRFGQKALERCHCLFPLEAVTGDWPYIEVVVPAPTLDAWEQATEWQKTTGNSFAYRFLRKSTERSPAA